MAHRARSQSDKDGIGGWFRSKWAEATGQSAAVAVPERLEKPAPDAGIAVSPPDNFAVDRRAHPTDTEAHAEDTLLNKIKEVWESRKQLERKKEEIVNLERGYVDVVLMGTDGSSVAYRLSPRTFPHVLDKVGDDSPLPVVLHHVMSNGGEPAATVDEMLARSNTDRIREWLGTLTELHLVASPPPHSYQLKEAPALLSEAGKLRVLVLRNHRIHTLPACVANMHDLQHLTLTDCNIKNWPAEDISKLHQLRVLDISGNQITSLKRVGELVTLEALNVSNNQLLQLPVEFGGLSHLTSLRAANNRMPTVTPELAKLTRLQVLDLSDNLIINTGKESLLRKFVSGASAVEHLVSLTHLNLSGNKISTSPLVNRLTALQHLNLSGNSIDQFPENMDMLVHLRYLNLAGNNLKDIPLSRLNLPSLTALHLGDNHLVEIPPSIDSLPKLEVLDAQGNDIESFPSCLALLAHLEAVILSRNRISVINPVCFSPKVTARRIDLDRNQLLMVPDTVASLPRLRSLSISRNQLKALPPLPPTLRSLDAEYNEVRSFSKFDQVALLDELLLAHNPLDQVGEIMLLAHKLCKLSLANLRVTARASAAPPASLPVVALLRSSGSRIAARCGGEPVPATPPVDADGGEEAVGDEDASAWSGKSTLLDLECLPSVEEEEEMEKAKNPEEHAPVTDVERFLSLCKSFVHPLVFKTVEELVRRSDDVSVFSEFIKYVLQALDPRFPPRREALSALFALSRERELRPSLEVGVPSIAHMVLSEWKEAHEDPSVTCVVLCMQVLIQMALDDRFHSMLLEHLTIDHLVEMEAADGQAHHLVQCEARKLLSIYGYVDHLEKRMQYAAPADGSERGIRILSLDGGGARAIVSIQVLKRIEQLTGKKTCELFDLIGGTSTGSLLAGLLGIRCMSAFDVESLYMKMIQKVFVSTPKDEEVSKWSEGLNFLTNLYHSGARYHTERFEEMLKIVYTEVTAYDSAGQLETPKVFMTSSDMSVVPAQPYLFRNYGFKAGHRSRYDGTCAHSLWQSIRATSAAPSLFEPLHWDGRNFQDGGLVANNPTGLAYHEASRLWPGRPFDCVLSLGTGLVHKAQAGGLKDIIVTFIESACSVERVDELFQDHVDPSVYFRFNPKGDAYDCLLDETSTGKLQAMADETKHWVETVQSDRLLRVAEILNPSAPPQAQ